MKEGMTQWILGKATKLIWNYDGPQPINESLYREETEYDECIWDINPLRLEKLAPLLLKSVSKI